MDRKSGIHRTVTRPFGPALLQPLIFALLRALLRGFSLPLGNRGSPGPSARIARETIKVLGTAAKSRDARGSNFAFATLMLWIAPSEKDPNNAALEKRLMPNAYTEDQVVEQPAIGLLAAES